MEPLRGEQPDLEKHEPDDQEPSDRRDPPSTTFGDWVTRLPHIPLFFMGLGVYRAWIEIVFVGSFIDFPVTSTAGQDVFDLTMVIVLFLGSVFAHRIGTLLPRKIAYLLCGLCLLVATAMMFLTLLRPDLAAALGTPAAVVGGFGIAIIILMWSEIYGRLNPLRVALYYSASIVTAALLIYLCRGLLLPWAFVIAILLPLVSLLCVLLAYRSLPVSETPVIPKSWFSFPWKPVLLMAIYGLAFGLKEVGLYTSSFGPHSSFGMVAVALLVFGGVLVQGPRFDFALVYRLGLPLMVGAFLLLPSFGFSSEVFADFCVSASYGAFSILTMLILANMSYRYGISALWLFGFERGIRALFVFLGRQISEHAYLLEPTGIDSHMAILVLIVLLIVVLSVLLFSERELSSSWGVVFRGETDNAADQAIIHKQTRATKVSELAHQYHLTQREEEVTLLLAQGKSISTIERELFIANGTAKAHVRHIYRKLDIHTRDDLLERVRD